MRTISRPFTLLFCCVPLSAVMAQADVPTAQPVASDVVETTVVSGDSYVSAKSLPEQVLAVKGSFKAPTEEDVKTTKADLDRKMQKLEQMLQRGSAENVANWKKYLRWDELVEELEKEKLDYNTLNEIVLRFKRNESGLEMYEFRGVRRAIEEYSNVVRYTSTSKKALTKIFDDRMDKFAKTLERYEEEPTMDDAAEIGAYLTFLERGKQAPELLQAISTRFDQPNTYSRISERLFSAGINQTVNQSAPVSDVILGTRIVGSQTTQGRAVAKFIPSRDTAMYQVITNATAHSQTTGFNRKFKIQSVGRTTIHVVKPFTLDIWGMTSRPSSASTHTSTNITGVSGARLRMVNNIASRRANEQKPQAEAIANERAQVRAARQVDTQAVDLINEGNQNYRKQILAPFLRLDYFPQHLRYTTTNDFLFAISTLASESQVAAPDRPESVISDDDLMMHIHESMIANYAEIRFAGITISSENMDQFRAENSDIIPDGLELAQPPKKDDEKEDEADKDTKKEADDEKEDDDKDDDKDEDEEEEPWEIKLVTRRPYRVYFDDDRVKIAVRGSRFKRGDSVLPSTAELEIAAEYKMQFGAEGAKLVRVGGVSTRFFTRKEGELEEMKKLSARHAGYKPSIVNAFEPMFRNEIEIEDIVLQGRWAKAGSLRLYTFDTTNGWITLGWKLSQPGSYMADYHETMDRNQF